MTYLADVPIVDLDPRIQRVIDAPLPTVSYASPTPLTMQVRLPSFDKPTFSTAQKLAIGGAVLLFLLARK